MPKIANNLYTNNAVNLCSKQMQLDHLSFVGRISPGISLEGMMLQQLKLQYFGHLMWRADSLEKTLMLAEIGGSRRRGQQRMRWLDGITDLMDVECEWTPGVGDGQGGLACCDSWGCKESGTTEWLNWTEKGQRGRMWVCSSQGPFRHIVKVLFYFSSFIEL